MVFIELYTWIKDNKSKTSVNITKTKRTMLFQTKTYRQNLAEQVTSHFGMYNCTLKHETYKATFQEVYSIWFWSYKPTIWFWRYIKNLSPVLVSILRQSTIKNKLCYGTKSKSSKTQTSIAQVLNWHQSHMSSCQIRVFPQTDINTWYRFIQGDVNSR